MANRLIEGWKNIPFPPSALTSRTGWLAIPNSAYYVMTGDVVGAAMNTSFELLSDGWVKCTQIGTSSYGHRLGIGRQFSTTLTVSATTVIFGGFRYKTPALVSNQLNRLFDIFDHSVGINGSSTSQNLIPLTALGAFQASTEFYIEWSIDMTTNTFKYRIDKGAEVVGTLTAQMIAALLANRCSWIIGGITGQAGGLTLYIHAKDIYINEKLATGQNNGWVGSIQAVPLYVESVTGSSTVSGAADAKSALNTPVVGQTDWDTPLVTTDATAPTLDIKLGMADVTGNLLAVQLNVAAKRPANSLAGVRAALKSGTTTGPSTFNGLAQTTKLGMVAISADATPENKPWTRAEVLATTVKLTASNT
jgi:hypothetical protein